MNFLIVGQNTSQNAPTPTATITGSLNQTQPAATIGVTITDLQGEAPVITDGAGTPLVGWSIAQVAGDNWDITAPNTVGTTNFFIEADNLVSDPLNQSETFILSSTAVSNPVNFVNDGTAEASFPAGSGAGAGTLADPTSDFDGALTGLTVGAGIIVVSKGAYTTTGYDLVENAGVGFTSTIPAGAFSVDSTSLVALKTGATELTKYNDNFIPASLVNSVNGVTTTTPTIAEIQATIDVMCLENMQNVYYNATDNQGVTETLEYIVTNGVVSDTTTPPPTGGAISTLYKDSVLRR